MYYTQELFLYYSFLQYLVTISKILHQKKH
nr:MAG TPA: hypothetical protein [Caudoviricetes sp.]